MAGKPKFWLKGAEKKGAAPVEGKGSKRDAFKENMKRFAKRGKPTRTSSRAPKR
jgi:hypothetical protein